MPSPLYSGAAAYLLSGFTGEAQLGWDFFEKLKANNTVSVRGNGAVLKSVASGEKPYGMLVDFMAMNAKQKGSPIEFVFPDEGVPAVTEPVAIMTTAKNVAGAKAVCRFHPVGCRTKARAGAGLSAGKGFGWTSELVAGRYQGQGDADRHQGDHREDGCRQGKVLGAVRRLGQSDRKPWRPGCEPGTPNLRDTNPAQVRSRRPAFSRKPTMSVRVKERRGHEMALTAVVAALIVLLSMLPMLRLLMEIIAPAVRFPTRRSAPASVRARPGSRLATP